MRTIVFLLGIIAVSTICWAGTPVVDRYGQTANITWPGKITSDTELQAVLVQEQRDLAEIQLDTDSFDRYGGVKTDPPRQATGFFRTEKIDNRWWLITPDGNRFFLKGVDAVPYGYFTNVYKPDGALREVFVDGVPDPKEYPTAWRPNGKEVSFLAANLQRKYGQVDFRAAWEELTEKRLRAWGFNASAKWNTPFIFDRMPYILDKALNIPRFNRYPDPFDPAFTTKLETSIEEIVSKKRDDPMLIGYQFDNENGWSRGTPVLLLKDSSGTLVGKRALLEFLAENNAGNAGEFFNLPDLSFDELALTSLSAINVPPELLYEFIRLASRRYHEILLATVRKFDANHLFLAASHCGHQCMEWIEGSLEYVDIVPLHEYNLKAPWLTKTIANPALTDKPFAVLEFSFTTRQRGFGVFSINIDVASEAARGQAYGIFTERLAADPRCVGFGYFTLHDQPITQRSHDPEAFNFGLIDVTDQPYQEMLVGVTAANQRLFAIHAGHETPRPLEELTKSPRYQEFMPGSVSEAVRLDSSNPHLHGGRDNRLRFTENSRFGVPLLMGTVDAGQPGGFVLLEFRVYLWENEKNRNLDDWFTIEESSDNIVFTPAAAVFKLVSDGTFPEYAMTPQTLQPDTRYVRLNFIMNNPAAPWATSLAATLLERK